MIRVPTLAERQNSHQPIVARCVLLRRKPGANHVCHTVDAIPHVVQKRQRQPRTRRSQARPSPQYAIARGMAACRCIAIKYATGRLKNAYHSSEDTSFANALCSRFVRGRIQASTNIRRGTTHGVKARHSGTFFDRRNTTLHARTKIPGERASVDRDRYPRARGDNDDCPPTAPVFPPAAPWLPESAFQPSRQFQRPVR